MVLFTNLKIGFAFFVILLTKKNFFTHLMSYIRLSVPSLRFQLVCMRLFVDKSKEKGPFFLQNHPFLFEPSGPLLRLDYATVPVMAADRLEAGVVWRPLRGRGHTLGTAWLCCRCRIPNRDFRLPFVFPLRGSPHGSGRHGSDIRNPWEKNVPAMFPGCSRRNSML